LNSKTQTNFFNLQRKLEFLELFPKYDRIKRYLGIEVGVGKYEQSIGTDIADMSLKDLDLACQESEEPFLPEKLADAQRIVSAYIRWQADSGNKNAEELAESLPLRYRIANHFPKYILKDSDRILETLARDYPPHMAHYQAVIAALCWAGLEYDHICSLSADAVTCENNTIKIQVEGHVLVIDDPLSAKIINAYMEVPNGARVFRNKYDAEVFVTDKFLRVVSTVRGNYVEKITSAHVKNNMSKVLNGNNSWYRGGCFELQRSGLFQRMYRAEMNGETDLSQYILNHEPFAPKGKRTIPDIIDGYKLYKKVYKL